MQDRRIWALWRKLRALCRDQGSPCDTAVTNYVRRMTGALTFSGGVLEYDDENVRAYATADERNHALLVHIKPIDVGAVFGLPRPDILIDKQRTVLKCSARSTNPAFEQAVTAAYYSHDRALMITVENCDDDSDGPMVTITCSDPAGAEFDQTVAGCQWEAPFDMDIAYAVVPDYPRLIDDLKGEGYAVNDDLYCPPDDL
jgi:hypothetical protein